MTDPALARALAAATSLAPAPRPGHACDCASCYEARRLEAERRSWRELDAARRAADRLRGTPCPVTRRRYVVHDFTVTRQHDTPEGLAT